MGDRETSFHPAHSIDLAPGGRIVGQPVRLGLEVDGVVAMSPGSGSIDRLFRGAAMDLGVFTGKGRDGDEYALALKSAQSGRGDLWRVTSLRLIDVVLLVRMLVISALWPAPEAGKAAPSSAAAKAADAAPRTRSGRSPPPSRWVELPRGPADRSLAGLGADSAGSPASVAPACRVPDELDVLHHCIVPRRPLPGETRRRFEDRPKRAS